MRKIVRLSLRDVACMVLHCDQCGRSYSFRPGTEDFRIPRQCCEGYSHRAQLSTAEGNGLGDILEQLNNTLLRLYQKAGEESFQFIIEVDGGLVGNG